MYFTESGFINRKKDVLVVVGQHHRIQTRIYSPDILGRKFGKLVPTKSLGQVINLIQKYGYVSDSVIEPLNT